MDRTIQAMKGHYILCGYGRLGRIICRELKASSIPMVVIEQKAEALQGLDGGEGYATSRTMPPAKRCSWRRASTEPRD